MTVAARRLHSVALDLDADAYLASWRPADGVLFLPALGESRVGEQVAARVGLSGRTARATLFGSVAMVRRLGRPTLPPGIELELDRGSLPAARFLAQAARGEPVDFRERAPRYAVDRAVLVTHGGAQREAALHDVSEGGCALVWRGSLPAVGEELSLRLGDGLFAATVRAVVCWRTAAGAPRPAVGLRVIAAGRAARSWRDLVAQAALGGRLPT